MPVQLSLLVEHPPIAELIQGEPRKIFGTRELTSITLACFSRGQQRHCSFTVYRTSGFEGQPIDVVELVINKKELVDLLLHEKSDHQSTHVVKIQLLNKECGRCYKYARD